MTSCEFISCVVLMEVGITYVVHQLRVLPLELLMSEH
jgi:hypothetical protein